MFENNALQYNNKYNKYKYILATNNIPFLSRSMEPIINKEGFSVYRNPQTNVYQISFSYSAVQLIKSLLHTNLIRGGAQTDEYYKTIRFRAESVLTLEQFKEQSFCQHGKQQLLVADTAKAIRSLTTQLKYLIEHESCTFIGYNVSNILVINDTEFLFLDNALISSFSRATEQTTITCPYQPYEFFFHQKCKLSNIFLIKFTTKPLFIASLVLSYTC